MSELHLLEGERLILDVSPTSNFKKYVMVNALLRELPFLAMINIIVTMSFYVIVGGDPITKVGLGPLLATYALLYLIFAAVIVALTLVLVNSMYKRYHYWATAVE